MEIIVKIPSRQAEFSPNMALSTFAEKPLISENPKRGFRPRFGVAYVEATNRISIQEVLALCSTEGIASQDPGPCYMGVDQGKELHVVIGKRHNFKTGKIVHIGIYKD
jgi:hypothetical protein